MTGNLAGRPTVWMSKLIRVVSIGKRENLLKRFSSPILANRSEKNSKKNSLPIKVCIFFPCRRTPKRHLYESERIDFKRRSFSRYWLCLEFGNWTLKIWKTSTYWVWMVLIIEIGLVFNLQSIKLCYRYLSKYSSR